MQRYLNCQREAAVNKGYLLPEDVDLVKPIAQPGDFISDRTAAR